MFFTRNYNSFDNNMKIIIKDIKNPYNNFNVIKEILQENQIGILTNIKYFGFFDRPQKKYVNNAELTLLWYYNDNTINIQYYIDTFGEFLFNDEYDVLTFSKYDEPYNIINDAMTYIKNKKNNIEMDTHSIEEKQLQLIAYDIAEFVLNENYDELLVDTHDEYEYKHDCLHQDDNEFEFSYHDDNEFVSSYQDDEHLYNNEYSSTHIIQSSDFD